MNSYCSKDVKLSIPMPLLLVIDDVGWWSGENGGHKNEPYRTGINRDHCLADYLAIIELAKRINMRIQIGMVLCDWSRNNILAKIPSTTWLGTSWKDPVSIDKLDYVANVLNENCKHLEICLHAVGHEFWEGNIMTRAEWADSNGIMRDKEQVKAHLDVFREIMHQNQLGDFPVSFIPAAFLHTFGEGNGIATILKDYGIRFISTPFERMKGAKQIQNKYFGIDNGIPTVDRGDNGIPWFETNPSIADKIFEGPICGIHWANILHSDAEQNMNTVELWAEKINSYGQMFDRIIAKDTFDCWTQLVYHCLADIHFVDNTMFFDFSKIKKMGIPFLNDSFHIKLETTKKINDYGNIIERSGNRYIIKIEVEKTNSIKMAGKS